MSHLHTLTKLGWDSRISKWGVSLHIKGIRKCYGSYDSMEHAGFIAWLAERHHLD
jgi:hypothetical protein